MILISYSDENLSHAELLVNYLDENIEMITDRITRSDTWRCSAGVYPSTSNFLRGNSGKVKAVVAIISPEGERRDEILFELGAAWALNLFILMIFLPGIDIRDMPEQLSRIPYVNVEARDAHIQLRDATRDIAARLGLKEKNGTHIFPSLDRTLKAMRNVLIWPEPINPVQNDDVDFTDEDFIIKEDKFIPSDAEFYDITYTVNGKAAVEEINIRASWNAIFKAIAPNLREPRDEAFVKKLILELCKEKNQDLRRGMEYKLFLNPLLNIECYTQIMNQFSSQNFIKTTHPPHSIFKKKRDDSRYWIITSEGEEYLRSSVEKLRLLKK
ncbi:MAG: hypothetical protein LBI74_00540 [Synergistaceae bacterium]|jgi:hypothetical protein|nr:hypothetical protein [Synergistaceae bacterium]